MRHAKLRALVDLSSETGSWLRVRGESMRPLLRPGDEVRLRALEAPPRRLEIAVFADRGRLTVHRLMFVRESSAVLKGDGAPGPGRAVPRESLFGAVAARRRESARPGSEQRREVLVAGSFRWRAASAWSLALSMGRWLRAKFFRS